MQRLKGDEDAVSSSISLIDRQNLFHINIIGASLFEDAQKKMAKWLHDYTDLHYVLLGGVSDAGSLGALAAVKPADRQKDVVICSIGAGKEALTEIRDPNSIFKASVAVFLENMVCIP